MAIKIEMSLFHERYRRAVARTAFKRRPRISMDDIRLIVFDLAGTTIIDNGSVPAAFIASLNAHEIVISDEDVRKVRGLSKREAVGRLLSKHSPDSCMDLSQMTDKIYKDFNSRLAEIYRKHGVHAVPRALQTFKWLHEKGIKTALNTGFDRSTVGIVLHSLHWENDMFDAVVCADDVSWGRPAPFMIFQAMELAEIFCVGQVANIGDTVLDLQAGWNARVQWNIAVLSGVHTADQLSHEKPTRIIQDIAEVPSLFS